MSISTRSLLIPGLVAATAATLAVAPAVVAPSAMPAALPPVAVPTVHIDDIQLAGIGRDIYDDVSAWIGGVIQWVEYPLYFVPPVGTWIADQINIVYFDLIQPLIGNTVYYLSDIVAAPLDFFGWTSSYLINQAYVGVRFANAEAAFFGLPPLPPLPFPPPPPLSATRNGTATPGTRAGVAPVDAAALAVSPAVEAPAEAAPAVSAPAAKPSRARVARTPHAAAATPAADSPTPGAATGAAPTSVREAAKSVRAEARKAAKAPRGAERASAG